MRYVALLRGVNVGGKNKVPMPRLKACFERGGFTDVSTYIQSGNVIFSSDPADDAALGATCTALIRDEFDLEVPVAVLAAADLTAALAHAPAWWGDDPESTHNAIVIVPPATVAQAFAAVGPARPEYEQVAHHGRIIFWSAPIKTYARTRWSKVVGTAIYPSITIRNVNTMRNLLALTQPTLPPA